MKRRFNSVLNLSVRPFKLQKSCSNQADNCSCISESILHKCPNEIIFHIFSFLETHDLSSFAFTCRASRLNVELYLSSSMCIQLEQFRNPHPTNASSSSSDFRKQIKYYYEIGALFRRVNCFLTHALRIDFLHDLLQSHLCYINACSKQNCASVTDVNSQFLVKDTCVIGGLRCPSLFFFGYFLHAFLLGCSDKEYQRVFHSLVHCCFGQNFWLRLTNLISKVPGECGNDELTVRLFLRRVFLDPIGLPACVRPTWSDIEEDSTHFGMTDSMGLRRHNDLEPSFTSLSPTDNLLSRLDSTELSFSSSFSSSQRESLSDSSSAFITSIPLVNLNTSTTCLSNSSRPESTWGTAKYLFNILRSYPFVHQARLLFIIYGPVHKGRLMWHIMCENTAADLKQLSACFGELGSVMSNMWLSGQWSADDTLAVLQEITCIPECWLAENVACLLHSAGPQLSSLSVRNRASRGHITELAVILTSLCLVQVKIKENLAGLLSLVGDAVNATDSVHKQKFLDSLAYAFRGVIVDLYETDGIDERIEDFSIILKAQSYFFRALLARVYEE